MHWKYVWIITATVCVMCFVASSSKRKNIEYGSFGLRSRRKHHANGGSSSLQHGEDGAIVQQEAEPVRHSGRTRWWRQPLVSRHSVNHSTASRTSEGDGSNRSTVDAVQPPIAHVHFVSIDLAPTREAAYGRRSDARRENEDCTNHDIFAARTIDAFASTMVSAESDQRQRNTVAVSSNTSPLCFRHFIAEVNDGDVPQQVSFSMDKAVVKRQVATAVRDLAASSKGSSSGPRTAEPGRLAVAAIHNRAMRKTLPILQRFLNQVVDPEERTDSQRASLDSGSVDDEGTVPLPTRRSLLLLVVIVAHTSDEASERASDADGVLVEWSRALSSHVQQRASATGNNDRIEVVVAPSSICAPPQPPQPLPLSVSSDSTKRHAARGDGAERCPNVTWCSGNHSGSGRGCVGSGGGVGGCCTHHVVPEVQWAFDAAATAATPTSDTAHTADGRVPAQPVGHATRFALALRRYLS